MTISTCDYFQRDCAIAVTRSDQDSSEVKVSQILKYPRVTYRVIAVSIVWAITAMVSFRSLFFS